MIILGLSSKSVNLGSTERHCSIWTHELESVNLHDGLEWFYIWKRLKE